MPMQGESVKCRPSVAVISNADVEFLPHHLQIHHPLVLAELKERDKGKTQATRRTAARFNQR